MAELKATVVFYDLDDASLAIISFEGRHLSNSELDALYGKAKQADMSTFGEVVVQVLDNLSDQNNQLLAILPRGKQIKHKAMERLIRDLLPANPGSMPIWRSDPNHRGVRLARMIRKIHLG